MPEDVQREFGRALMVAQFGGRSRLATPLKEFRGASVLEIRDDHDTDTYRCVYTVRFADVVYVLHAFQKRSHRGIRTPQHDTNLIRSRPQLAEEDHRRTYGGGS